MYFGDNYSLSGSFCVRTAQITHLTSRASQRALETVTPSSPGYDGGMHFHRHVRQGCKKLARIKQLGIRPCRSFRQILSSWLVKTKKLQNDKKDRWHCDCHHRHCIVSPVAKSSTPFCPEGSSYFPADFQAKVPQCCPRAGFVAGFVEGQRNGLCWCLIPGLLIAAKASRRSASLSICRIRLRRTFFCFREAKLKPEDFSLSQGSLMKNLEGGHPNQQQKRVATAIWQ